MTKERQTTDNVYWKYVEKYGQAACDEAVVAYYDQCTVASILLEQMDAEDLEEFLHDNLGE